MRGRKKENKWTNENNKISRVKIDFLEIILQIKNFSALPN